ncbi:ABC transporter ATP-binding protein [Tabrizicola oligotrophica]|uniref:ABC transporter ATP-binding protein n=1 Tax=Tabrizicola oligotrophica TaxID=2710650 RepID=A0A6M0QWJ0_9RHOB|nr:ABC transporter ATP-binding protein [Tabrizicola oligotrophica]NEY91819.1 ABC transporter ATP-binding protein [Tabrizicola oligotrophica]
MASVTLTGAQKRFGNVTVISGVDLQIADGEFVVFVGPSGCGKSTLLRMIAGLEDFSGGSLQIGGKHMEDVMASKRGVAMVFQSYALYPHMTVARNIGFALETNGMPRAEIARKTREVAELLKIGKLLDRKPRELSGGQRQRVAIGRALVRSPDVFLFDEPLSNLDADLRTEMRAEIARLHKELGVTMIYVTHDQVEAMTLADRIVVLREGRIEQVGTPAELYAHPANEFVASFIGSPRMNFAAAADVPGRGMGGAVKLGVRPEAILLSSSGLAATLERVEDLGHEQLIYVRLENGRLWTLRAAKDADVPQPGAPIFLDWPDAATYGFDAAGRAVQRSAA